jgi:phosphoglycerate-specific signal transduction histidine kinase
MVLNHAMKYMNELEGISDVNRNEHHFREELKKIINDAQKLESAMMVYVEHLWVIEANDRS